MAGPKTLSLSTGAVTSGNSSSLPVVTGQGNTQTQTSQNYLASLGISLPTNTASSNLNTGLVGAGQQTTNILDQSAINAKYQDTGTYISKSDQALITRQNLLQTGVSAQKQAIENYYNDLILGQYGDPNRNVKTIRFNESSTDKIVNRIYNQINSEEYNQSYDTGYTSAYGKYYNGDYKLGRELAQQAGGSAHDWGTGFIKGIDALVDMFQDTVLGGDTGIDGWDILTRKYEGYTAGMNIAQQKDVETASWQYGANVANQIVFSGVQNILDTASTVLLMGTGGLITDGIAGAIEGAKAALGTSAINALLGRATDVSLNIMALRVLGDSYSEMTQNSPFAKTSEAFAHAAVSAATEYFTEKMSGWGAIGAQGSDTAGAIDSLWEAIATSVFGTTGVGGVMSTLAMGFMGESFEEIVSQCAGDIVNEAFYRANGLTGSMDKSSFEDYLTAGLVGGLSGAIGGASHLVFNYAQQTSMFQQFKEKIKALAGIVDDPVVDQAQTEEAQRLTEEAKKQMEVQKTQQAQISFAEGARRSMQQATELANIGLSYKAFWEALNKQYSEVDPKQATSLFERLMQEKTDAETIKTQMDNQARATLDNLQSEMGQERVDAAELQKFYDQLGLAGANHIITKGVENIGKGANNAAVTALTGQMKAEESMPRGTRAEQLRAKQDEAFLESQRQKRAKEKQARLKEALKIKHGEKLPAYQRDIQRRKEAKAAEAKAKAEAKQKAEEERKAAEAKAKAEYESNFNENNDFRTLSDAGDHSMTLGANIAKQPSGWLIDIYTGKQTSDNVSKEAASRELQRRLNYERGTGKRSVNPSVAPVAPVAQNTDVAPVAPVAQEAEVAQPAPAPTIQEADTAMDSTLPVGPTVAEETTPVTPVEEPKLAEWEQPLTAQEQAEAEARANAIEEAEAKADAYKSFTTAKEFKDFIANNDISDERRAEIIEFAYSVLKGGQKAAFTRFLNQRYGAKVSQSIQEKAEEVKRETIVIKGYEGGLGLSIGADVQVPTVNVDRSGYEERRANVQRALQEQVARAEAYAREQEALKKAEEEEKLACAVPTETVEEDIEGGYREDQDLSSIYEDFDEEFRSDFRTEEEEVEFDPNKGTIEELNKTGRTFIGTSIENEEYKQHSNDEVMDAKERKNFQYLKDALIKNDTESTAYMVCQNGIVEAQLYDNSDPRHTGAKSNSPLTNDTMISEDTFNEENEDETIDIPYENYRNMRESLQNGGKVVIKCDASSVKGVVNHLANTVDAKRFIVNPNSLGKVNWSGTVVIYTEGHDYNFGKTDVNLDISTKQEEAPVEAPKTQEVSAARKTEVEANRARFIDRFKELRQYLTDKLYPARMYDRNTRENYYKGLERDSRTINAMKLSDTIAEVMKNPEKYGFTLVYTNRNAHAIKTINGKTYLIGKSEVEEFTFNNLTFGIFDETLTKEYIETANDYDIHNATSYKTALDIVDKWTSDANLISLSNEVNQNLYAMKEIVKPAVSKYESAYQAYKDEFTRLNGGEEIDAETYDKLMDILKVIDSGEFNTKNDDFYNYIIPACDEAWLDAHLVRTVADYMLGQQDGIQAMAYGKSEEQKLYEQYKEEQNRMGESYVDLDTYRRTILPRVRQQQKTTQTVKNAVSNGQTVTEQMQRKLAEDAAWGLAQPYETSAEQIKERAKSPFVKMLVDVATKNGYKFYVYPAHISKAITDTVGIGQAFGLTVHPHHGIGLDIESATSVAKNFYENRAGYKKAYDSAEEAIQAKIDNVIGHECIHAIMGRTIKAVTEGKGTQQQRAAVQKLDMLFKQALNVYQAQNPNSTETPYAFTSLEEFVSELANDRMRAWLFTNVKNAQGIITSTYKNAAMEAGIKVDDTGFSALLSISDVLAYENSARSISDTMKQYGVEFPTSLFMSSSRMLGWEVKIQFSQIQKALRGAEEEKKDVEEERKIEEKWSNTKSRGQQAKLNSAATASTATKATSGMFRNLDSPFASQSVEGLKFSQTNSLTGYELYYATGRTRGGNNIEYYVFDPSKKQTINGKEQGTCIAKISPSDDAYGTALSILKGNTEYHYVANLIVDPQALAGLQPTVVETSKQFKYDGRDVAYPKAYAPSDVATIAYKIQEYMSTQVNKGRGDIDTIYKEAIESVKKENTVSYAKYEAFTNAGIVDFDAIKALNPNAFEVELTTDFDNGDIATINNTWDSFEGDHPRTNRTPLIVKFKESTSLKERKNFEATVYAMIDRIAQSGVTIQGEHYTITRATANDLKHKKVRMTSSELVGDFGAPTQLRETVAALEEKVNAGTATAEEITKYRQLMTRLKLNGGLNNEQIRKPGSKTWTNAGVGQTGSESYASVSKREVKLKDRQIRKNEERKKEGKVALPVTGRIFKGQGKLGECIVVRDIFQQFSERLMSVDGKNGRVGSYEGTISGNWKEAQDGMGLTDGSTFQMRSNVMGHKGVLCSATNWQNAIMEHGAKTLASLSKDLGAQVTTLYSDEYGRVYTNLDLPQLKSEGAEVFPMMGEDPNGSGQIGLYDRWGTWMSLTKNQFTGMDVHHLLTDSMVKFAGSYGNKAAGISGTQDYYRWCGNEDIRIIPKENIYGSGFQDQIDPDADVSAGEEELRSKRKLAIRQMLRGMEVDETDLEHIMANTREYCQQILDNIDMQRALLKGSDPIFDRLIDKFPSIIDTTFAQQKIDNKINRIIALASFSTIQTEAVDRQYSWILADPINIISYLSGEVTGIGIASEEDAKQQLGNIAEMPKNYHGTSVAKYGLLDTENYYADDATYEQGYDTNKVVAPNMREGGSVITRSPMTSKHDARAVINDKSGIMPAMKNYSSKGSRMEIDRDILYVKLNSSIMQRLDNDFDGDTSTMMQDAAIVATILKNTCLARKKGYDEVTSFPHGKAAKTDTTYNSLLFSLKACMTDAGVGMYDVMLDRVYNSPYLTETMQEEFAATAAAGYILATDYTKTGYMPKAFLDYMEEVKSYLNARVTKIDGKTCIVRESAEGTQVYEYNENGWVLTDLSYNTDTQEFKALPKVAGSPDYYHYGKFNKQDTFKREKGIQFSNEQKDTDWMNPERTSYTIKRSRENNGESNKRNFSSRAYEYALGIGEYDSKQNKRSLMYEPTTEEGKTTAENKILRKKAMTTEEGNIRFNKTLTANAKAIIEGLFIGDKTIETSGEAIRAVDAYEDDMKALAKKFDTMANPYTESEEVKKYYEKYAKRGRFGESHKVFAEIGDTYVAEPLGVSNPKKLSKKDYEYYSEFLKPSFEMLYRYTGNTTDAINALTYFLMRSTNSFANISYSYLSDYIMACQDDGKVYDFNDFMEQMYAIDQTPEEVKQSSIGFADNQYAETSKGEPMMDTMNDIGVQAYESWEDDFESDMGDSTTEMSGRMYGADESEMDDADFVTSAIVGQNTPVDEDILNAMDEATDNGMPTQDTSFEDSLPVMTMDEAMKAGFVTAEPADAAMVGLTTEERKEVERQLKQTGRLSYPSEDPSVIEAYNEYAEELGWETVGQPFKTGFKNNAKLNQAFAWSESKRDDVMKNLPVTDEIEDDEGIDEAEFATQNVREPNREMPRTEIPIEEGEESESSLQNNISEKINLRDWAKRQLKDFVDRKLKVDYESSDGENSTQMYYERCMKYIDDVIKGKSPENLWRLWVDGWSQHSDPLFDNSSEIISQMTKICDLYNNIYSTNAKDSEFSQYQYRVKAAVEAITAHIERFDATQERVKKMTEELDTGMKDNKYRKFFSKEKNWLMNKITRHFTKSMSPGPLLRILGMENKDSELYKFGDEIEAAGLQQDEMNAVFNRRLSGLMEVFGLDPYHQKTKFIKQLEEKLTADSGLYGLSTGKIINLYNTLQDDAGFQHLVSSGFEAVDKEGNKYIQKLGQKKDQIKMEDFRTAVKDYVDSDVQLKAIAKMCRETLNEYSKYVEKYRRETLGVKASEAVIKENYWMLRVGMSQDDRTMTQDENVKLLDEYLSTRSRNVTNDGPIMAIDALESLNQYCTQMARICSFGPIKMALHQMSAVGKNTGGVYNFKDRLQKLGFNDVAAYIQDFSDELSGTKTSSTDGINGILKNFANAALTGGITVAMKQKASFWNALAEVPMKYLGKYWGLTSLSTEKFLADSRIKAISKYTGFIDARRGDVDYVTSLRGDVKRGMGEEANLGTLGKWINDRTPDVFKGMIPGSDVQTVCRVAWATWDMVKDQNEQWRDMTDTALENEPAFLEAVAKKFSSIGSKTQPMYNVAFRSMTQRSTGIERAVLMFRTQQNRNLNEIMEGIAESEFNGDKTKLNGAVAGLSLASAEYAILTVLGTLFKGKIDSLDDDDDGIDLWDIASEVLSQSAMSVVATDWIADAVGDVLMAGLTDGKYYGIEVNGVAQASDLATSIVSTMQGVKNGNWSKAGKNAWKALQAAMMITGIPLQNAWNTIAAPFRAAFSIAEMTQLEQEVVKAAQAEGVDASGLLQNGSNLNVSGTGDIVAQAQAKVAQNASYVDRAEALMAEAGIKSNDENYSAIRTQVVSMLKEQDAQKTSVTGLSTGNALIDNALEDVATDEYYKQAADALLAQNGMTSTNTENYAAIRSSVIKGLKEMDETPKTSPTLTGNSLVDESISDYNTTLYYSQAADALLGAYGMTKDNTADYSTLKSQVVSNLKQMDKDYNTYVAKGMDKIFPNVDTWKEFKETADADDSGTVTQDEVNEYVAQHPEAKDYMTAYWNATWTTTKKKNF